MNGDLINLFLQVGLLKKTPRTGWVLKNIKDPESVAEHIYRVSIIAMILAKKLEVDELRLIKMALVHDLGEAIIGDLKWESGVKVVASQKDKHKDERLAIQKIFKGYSEYIDLWDEFNELKTKEAKALKLIDKLEMGIQAYEYKKEGYDNLDEFFENVQKYLRGSNLEKLFEGLMDMPSL